MTKMQAKITRAKTNIKWCNVAFHLMFWTIVALVGLCLMFYCKYLQNKPDVNWMNTTWFWNVLHHLPITLWIMFGIACTFFLAQEFMDITIFFKVIFTKTKKYRIESIFWCFFGIFLIPFISWIAIAIARTCFVVQLDELKMQVMKEENHEYR